jgi:uncharacterized protein (TIGR02246 family)
MTVRGRVSQATVLALAATLSSAPWVRVDVRAQQVVEGVVRQTQVLGEQVVSEQVIGEQIISERVISERVVEGGPVVAAPAASAVAEDSTDFELISRDADALMKAFAAGDAPAIAGMFLPQGEVVDEDGNVTAGTHEIEALFARFFEKFPGATLDLEVLDVRSLAADLLVEEGVRRIETVEGAAVAQMRYVAVRKRDGDRWPVASYMEYADDPDPTPGEMLASLDWLVGDWVDESPAGRTVINYRWSDDGNFLLGEYNLAVGGRSETTSQQRIGWDPVRSQLRSWTFDADGGFSEGDWAAGKDGWIVRSRATLPDGTSGAATVRIGPDGPDHFVVESTDRIIGGAEEPDFRLRAARRPPAPGAALSAASPDAGTSSDAATRATP